MYSSSSLAAGVLSASVLKTSISHSPVFWQQNEPYMLSLLLPVGKARSRWHLEHPNFKNQNESILMKHSVVGVPSPGTNLFCSFIKFNILVLNSIKSLMLLVKVGSDSSLCTSNTDAFLWNGVANFPAMFFLNVLYYVWKKLLSSALSLWSPVLLLFTVTCFEVT